MLLEPVLPLRLVRVEALQAAGRTAAAREAAQSLVTDLQQRGATRSWSYVVALELDALVTADSGDPSLALAGLQRIAAGTGSLTAPSAVERAESLLRRARLHRLAGQHESARALAEQASTLLASQHAQSPRRFAVTALLAP
jgi:hypothetical protein